jgi:hypothetical protein
MHIRLMWCCLQGEKRKHTWVRFLDIKRCKSMASCRQAKTNFMKDKLKLREVSSRDICYRYVVCIVKTALCVMQLRFTLLNFGLASFVRYHQASCFNSCSNFRDWLPAGRLPFPFKSQMQSKAPQRAADGWLAVFLQRLRAKHGQNLVAATGILVKRNDRLWNGNQAEQAVKRAENWKS